MSGVKQTYRTITVEQYNQLVHQAQSATNITAVNRRLQELIRQNEEAVRSYRRRIETLNTSMNSLQSQLSKDRAAATAREQALRKDLARIVANSDAALRKEAERRQKEISRLNNEMHNGLNQVRREAHEEIQATSQRLSTIMQQNDRALRALVAETAAALSNEIDAVRNDVTTLQERMGRMESGAAALAEDAAGFYRIAQEVLQNTMDSFRTQLVPAEQLQAVRNQLQTAQENISIAAQNPVNAPAARLSAANAFQAVVAYRQAVVQAEQEWNEHYQAVLQAMNVAQEQLDASRTIQIDGSSYEIDVDHWTCGELAEINGRLNSMRRSLSDPEELTVQDLDSFRDNAVRRSEEIEEAAAFAIAAVNASQTRRDSSAEIRRQLRDQLGLVGEPLSNGRVGAFEGSDYRAAYRMRLKNPHTGFDVVITQTPETTPDGSLAIRCTFDVLQHSNDRSEEAEHQLLRQIMNMISPEGYDSSAPVETVEGFENRLSDLVLDTEWATQTEKRPDSVPSFRSKSPAGQRAAK